MEPRTLIECAIIGLHRALSEYDGPPIGPDSLVALQLPAGLSRHFGELSLSVREGRGCDVIVLMRPTYGACDIPYGNLTGLGITHVVHVGHAPIPQAREPIPTIFVPVRMEIDFKVLSKSLDESVTEHSLAGKKAVLTSTIQYTESLPALARELRDRGVETILIEPGGRIAEPGQILGCNFFCSRSDDADVMIYLGTGAFHPMGMANGTGLPVLALSPYGDGSVLYEGMDFLKKRAAIALSLSNAERFAIAVCTKPGQNRISLARELVKKGRTTGRDCELVLMDEFHPDNFIGLDIEAVVSTACPRIAYDDGKNYPVPVITPREFLLAICDISIDGFTMDELD